jgi:23S rRNA pseudouridine2604 synthase
LVKKLQISNKEVQKLLLEKKILVNNKTISANIEIAPEDEIKLESRVLQEAKNFKYLAYYKPKGIETTLNQNIQDNLLAVLPEKEVFPIGRLDKASEGLLLLSDDGRLYDKILRKEFNIEKEYEVKVDKLIDENFIHIMANGIEIMGKKTLPCKLEKIDDFTFRITLIQGLNRQIRRMCYKLNYEVLALKRIRIGGLKLGNLKPTEYYYFKPQQITEKD